MHCNNFSGSVFPGCYWGSYGYPLGYSVGCGYGSTYSPVGYGCGYGYSGWGGPLSYRRYWPYALY
ncbi:keratin-associated protein 8-1 [Rhinolophus sinicus]|uniref:keratin-associated protein 8-1 n=1 Tax=Rhinolophus sinicus TaxID=89399 RepID=UPI00094292F8|nr:PREDICTED: keratin-associated protein 8-1 [Rhinolophus sinicus]